MAALLGDSCVVFDPERLALIQQRQEVKAEIMNTTERLASVRQELQVVQQELLEKNQQLEEEDLEREFIRVREEVLAAFEQDLLAEIKTLNQLTAEHKLRASEENKRFLAELSVFTTHHSVWGREGRRCMERDRLAAVEESISQLASELENIEAELLKMVPLQQQIQTLTEEIASQRAHLSQLESERHEACEATESLHREKEKLGEKLRTDPEFVRLQQQLQAYKDESARVL
ncbi:coiled-coil domain-containing protein 172-like isoform X2 [Petromyzon marinus]|uniref:Coiled-coil domain-containing protein 172 n=1 Tax=Petromyzon marinus TaxID=7757 RepID=A0AAJ7T1E8_PETMA|nr:coiled-coil domain-containing protein 172-like isoform X2 [Petromyzon marinus]